MYFFNLNRTPETKGLLNALVHFERNKKCWNFPHGEIHKRKMSRWLRRNSSSVLASLQPEPSSLVQESRKCAIQILSFVSILRDRRKIPTKPVDRIESLLKPIWDSETRPAVFSSELEGVLKDIEVNHERIRKFVVMEYGAEQGNADPKDFIDAAAILNLVSEDVTVEPPDSTLVANSFWKTRFSSVSNLRAYGRLSERFDKERSEMQKTVDRVTTFVSDSGFDTENLTEGLSSALEELIEVICLQRGKPGQRGVLSYPDDDFDQLWQKQLIQTPGTRDSWGVAINRAKDVVNKSDPLSLVTFSPVKLIECRESISIVTRFLDRIDEQMKTEEEFDASQGSGLDDLTNVLAQIENLSSSSDKKEEESE